MTAAAPSGARSADPAAVPGEAGPGEAGPGGAVPGEAAARAIAALRQWCLVGQEALTSAREEIDALNVYPVPDGDTGTNLLLTMESVVAALEAHAERDLSVAAAAMADGALLGARGNSGVILSQLLRGVADVLTAGGVDGREINEGDVLAAALTRASELGYAAVAHPVEGTVLTVARAAAAAAAEAARANPHDPVAVARSAADAAHEALEHTPEQLPALATAGVVDAGGQGLCLLLDALVAVMSRQPLPARSSSDRPARPTSAERWATREAGSTDFAYEVQYLLAADDAAVEVLRRQLDGLGDSLVVVGGNGTWNVHVHVNDPGAAVERGVEAGRPSRITITRFADQIAAREASTEAGAPAPAGGDAPPRAWVAVVSGAGLARHYRRAGARVVDGGPTHNPATRDLLAAIAETEAQEIVLLPNHGNIRGVAEQAAASARADGRTVAVVPTRSPLQGLAAIAVADPDLPVEQDVEAMTEAATATRWGEVTVAVRAARTEAGACVPGDVLGLVEGKVVAIGTDVLDVGLQVLDCLVGPASEIVTLAVGAQAPDDLGARLRAGALVRWPALSVEVLTGEQPHYPLLLAVE